MKKYLIYFTSMLFLGSCGRGNGDFDASGTFEAEEVIVSAETAGRILSFHADEGKLLRAGELAAVIDTSALQLQALQVEASMAALRDKTTDVQPYIRTLEQQMVLQRTQLKAYERERDRVANLVKEDAATLKQLDEAETLVQVGREQLALTQRQLEQQKNIIGTQNRSILSEQAPLEARRAQISDQLYKARVINPIAGTVLTSYAEAGEVTAPGKALYKIADLSYLQLRAYISGEQMALVKTGQDVKVLIDHGKEYKELSGSVIWISDKAEFTPKTIQTRDERAHLVYAMKIRVKNDGALKIGMYGEVKF
ncbi:MAG: HlyD family efflux transporter periplasmic adaptor subunit [Bacteroidia bacterium]|nr:HlyD family efflux transporter periplasmic adaptor subunit [Bacteroidia bacterium]